jgi:ABC-type microcin C transport system duplicated ATPase subunit YejF
LNLVRIAIPGKREQPSSESSIVLEVENLNVFYPGKKTLFGKRAPVFKALDNVSFFCK